MPIASGSRHGQHHGQRTLLMSWSSSAALADALHLRDLHLSQRAPVATRANPFVKVSLSTEPLSQSAGMIICRKLSIASGVTMPHPTLQATGLTGVTLVPSLPRSTDSDQEQPRSPLALVLHHSTTIKVVHP